MSVDLVLSHSFYVPLPYFVENSNSCCRKHQPAFGIIGQLKYTLSLKFRFNVILNFNIVAELTITNRGLFLGKQAQIIEELDEPFFFEGYIDDVSAVN